MVGLLFQQYANASIEKFISENVLYHQTMNDIDYAPENLNNLLILLCAVAFAGEVTAEVKLACWIRKS